MFAAIEGAKFRIGLSTYIFRTDELACNSLVHWSGPIAEGSEFAF